MRFRQSGCRLPLAKPQIQSDHQRQVSIHPKERPELTSKTYLAGALDAIEVSSNGLAASENSQF